MAKYKRGPKDEYPDLTSEEREGIESMSEQEIRDRIAQAAMDQSALEQAQRDDQDLQEKKSAAREAGACYREGRNRLKQLVKFARATLDARGKDSGTSPTEE